MSERFGMYQSELTELWIITDAKRKVTFSGINDKYNCQRIVDLLNKLHLENEQLKKENQHFRKVFGNKYDAYIDGEIGGNVNEM